jgi:hypothetical protein
MSHNKCVFPFFKIERRWVEQKEGRKDGGNDWRGRRRRRERERKRERERGSAQKKKGK